jgi:outer membrane protein OmpA-like peptidoglycan-associated protein
MLPRRVLVCLFLVSTITLSGQYTKEFKRIFFDASYLYETGFYEEALKRYNNLLALDPGNCNILFHCGVCCLNIQGKELEALTHLKEAVKCATGDFKDNAPDETRSPILTYYMLGRAYHLNDEFDQARKYYEMYLAEGKDEPPLELDYARLQIEACNRAEEIVNNPPSFKFQSVLDHFDEYLPSCSNPVISGDGSTLIFLVDFPDDKKVMETTLEGEYWTKPRVINSEIGMVGETYPVSLSYDGKELYLVHEYYSHSDILVSTFEDGSWTEARELGGNVNGRTSETHASISKGGNTLYFTSDTRGGEGGFDIYVSRKNGKDQWGVPENLGPVINTRFDEQTPFISSNDSILFFSSQGHASIGGTDVFFSVMGPDGTWGEPVSLGAPVNTTGEDIFFNPGWNELNGVYAVRKEDDPASSTINMVIEVDPDEPIVEVVEPEETEDIPEETTGGSADTIIIIQQAPVPATTELLTSIPFEFNKYTLNTEAQLEASILAEFLMDNPESEVLLSGHTDATGPSEFNMLLSMQRVDQVADYLERKGVESSRIKLEGKGEDAPIAINYSPDRKELILGRYLNRHVIATITGDSLPVPSVMSGLYVPRSLRNDEGRGNAAPVRSYSFTIQVKASYSPISPDVFRELSEVKEYVCSDGYYRYATGSFPDFATAREYLDEMQRLGFEDAFIQSLSYYERVKKLENP